MKENDATEANSVNSNIPALKPQICTKCGLTKPAYEFGAHSRKCRQCCNAKAKEAHIKKHPELKKYPKIPWYD